MSIDSVIANTGTLKSNYLDPLPTEIRPAWSSYVGAQVSIAAKAGYTIHVEKSPASLVKPFVLTAVVVAGFLGVVAVL